MSLFSELKRRNVIRVAMAYVVASWLIIQVVETILPAYGMGDAAIRLVVTLLAIAFIPTLVFSWAFEITPEGLKREVDVVREHSITRFTGKKLDRIIMVLLAVATGYFAFDKFVLDPARDAELVAETEQQIRSDVLTESYGDKSIAVLPFVNMSSDPEQEYFSDGISEELLNLLSKIPELRVISRSSAFSFKGKDIDIPTIAAQLNVAHIIEGSVRKDGNQVRITAQLIEARSDTHLWSETYDRELKNIFVIQDEISAAIIGSLRERMNLEIEETPRVITPARTEAHDAYLRGRYLVVQRTRPALQGAVQEFEKAVILNPEYALAHAELAMAILLGGSRDDDTPATVLAEPHVEQAMSLDPNLAEAHAAFGLLLSAQWEHWDQQHLENALAQFERAIQINPNYSMVYTWMASLLERKLGRYAEAYAASEAALQLNPMSIPARVSHVTALMNRNRMDEARQELEKLAAIHPQVYLQLRGELTGHGGYWANALLGNLDVMQAYPESMGIVLVQTMARQFAALGLEKEALAIHEIAWPVTLSMLGRPEDAVTTAEARFAENPEVEVWEAQLGLALAAAGDTERARPFLERMLQFSGRRVALYNDLFTYIHAVALATIRRNAGEEEGVGELVAAISDDVRRLREAGIASTDYPLVFNIDAVEGIASYIAGEHQRGLSLIAKASDDGYFILPNEAYLQSLYDDPDFAPIMAGQLAQQSRERNRFLAIVCTDNPYQQVWQPAEGTCERFAAEEGN